MKYSESDTIQKQQETQTSFSTISPGEIIIGTLVEVDGEGQPLVDFPENPSEQPSKAMTTLGLTQINIGRQVALLFANGNLQTPVIMGMIHSPLQEMLENFEQSQSEEGAEQESRLEVDDVLVDGEKIVFEAKEKIILKCGESSITLTKNGKISIRGKNLLNRATVTNQIKGGTIQVN